ncbi:hypothetical protein N7510_010900 [Penicillium lagena]|uniref:uncharacterized protein n=1 Tax=Penicillium lagena TaxID=94218 RepID=UPI0025420B42|nr:uncharacterized protein N7510_010900 [Penicillium lagena]KAJ5601366.1 hypothetical protein N7510_010900 [Penicillium lagena]
MVPPASSRGFIPSILRIRPYRLSGERGSVSWNPDSRLFSFVVAFHPTWDPVIAKLLACFTIAFQLASKRPSCFTGAVRPGSSMVLCPPTVLPVGSILVGY